MLFSSKPALPPLNQLLILSARPGEGGGSGEGGGGGGGEGEGCGGGGLPTCHHANPCQ